MIPELSEKDRKLYGRLYISDEDLTFARFCIQTVLKKKWHGPPWERRGTAYFQQTVYMTALVTSYARPFTRSRGWPKLPDDLVTFNAAEMRLHAEVIKLRHKVYAHADGDTYEITPWMLDELPTAIVSGPLYLLDAVKCRRLDRMVGKLIDAIHGRLNALVQAAEIDA